MHYSITPASTTAGVVCDGLNVLNDLNALNGPGNQRATSPI